MQISQRLLRPVTLSLRMQVLWWRVLLQVLINHQENLLCMRLHSILKIAQKLCSWVLAYMRWPAIPRTCRSPQAPSCTQKVPPSATVHLMAPSPGRQQGASHCQRNPLMTPSTWMGMRVVDLTGMFASVVAETLTVCLTWSVIFCSTLASSPSSVCTATTVPPRKPMWCSILPADTKMRCVHCCITI